MTRVRLAEYPDGSLGDVSPTFLDAAQPLDEVVDGLFGQVHGLLLNEGHRGGIPMVVDGFAGQG